jgi:predicted component of type VI protein secretion system
MDIGQTLLNHAEYCNLHLWGQALELLRYIERCWNVAPPCEAVRVPPNRRRKTYLVKQGGME